MSRGMAYRANGELESAASDLYRAISLADDHFPAAMKLLILTYNDIGVHMYK